jgi:hypothetical protein
MAIALVGSVGVASQGAAGAAVTPAWGTSENRTAGNLLICWCTVTGVATLPTTPSGWSIGKQVAGTSCSATIYFKLAAGADTAPTIALITSGLIAAQLSEWSGALAFVDQSGSSTGTASPNTATAGGANQATAELILMAAADFRSVARTTSDTWTSNDGTVTLAGSNNGVSSVNHYTEGYIASSTATTAQTSVVTLSVATSITGIANVNVSFNVPAPKTPAPTSASMTLSGATPTVSTPILTQPTTASMTLTGAIPAVSAGGTQSLQPTAGALSLTGAIPAVGTPDVVLPTAANMTLAGSTPTVAVATVSAPTSASMTFTGAIPTVTAIGTASRQPTPASMTLAGGTPVVVTPVVAAPSAGALSLAGATPLVATPRVSVPTAASVTLNGATPTVTAGGSQVRVPDFVSLTTTLATPNVTVTAGQAITVLPGMAALITALSTPVVTIGTPIVAEKEHGGSRATKPPPGAMVMQPNQRPYIEPTLPPYLSEEELRVLLLIMD